MIESEELKKMRGAIWGLFKDTHYALKHPAVWENCDDDTCRQAHEILRTIDALIGQIAQAEKPELIPIAEVKMDNLSPVAIQAAAAYMAVVDEYDNAENHTDVNTSRQLEARRKRLHDIFIRELNSCGVNTGDRAATTRLAEYIVRNYT